MGRIKLHNIVQIACIVGGLIALRYSVVVAALIFGVGLGVGVVYRVTEIS